MIPFFDLKRQYKNIWDELQHASKAVFESGSFISGKQVKEFEKRFADYINIRNCISCASGTDALELVLRAWDIKDGDEVIVPAFTWISDAEAVTAVGAKPVFVDVNELDFNLDPQKIKDKITGRTKAVIAVHLFGHPAQMTEIKQIAKENDLLLLEDCAQSHGAAYKEQKTGSLGDAAIFSFYPTKNLGAYGDAGAVVTNDDKVAEKIRLLADHGQVAKNEHALSGYNSRLDELQAAYINVKLNFLDQWNRRRQQIAKKYILELKGQENIILPDISEDADHVFHQFVIRSKNRDALREYLSQRGIGTAIHYPYPLPTTKPFNEVDSKINYPIASALAEQVVSIPIFPELENEEINYVIESLKSFSSGKA